nr:TetR/AcrR family transcriptional regulator [Micromonospora sp. DSM 115978]
MAAKVMGAADLFAKRGLDGAKMNDIATATGIPRATLYYHFEGKGAVFSYMCDLIFDAFQEAVADALNLPGSAAERLSHVIRAQISVYAAFPIAFQAIHLDLGRAARRPEIIEQSERAYIRPVAKLLEEGAADGSLRKVNKPRAVAAALLGAMSVVTGQALSPRDENGAAELHEAMMSLVLQGLEARPQDC